MYEKPQYLTREGYRRTSKNPHKKKLTKKLLSMKKTPSSKSILPVDYFKSQSRRGISKEAAKLIAHAIKGMLHE